MRLPVKEQTILHSVTRSPKEFSMSLMPEALGFRAGETQWFEISKKIEDLMIREKSIITNVDFYFASAY